MCLHTGIPQVIAEMTQHKKSKGLRDKGSPENESPIVPPLIIIPMSPTDPSIPPMVDFERREGELAKNHYFDNEMVELLLYDYLEGGCIDVVLRDKIMDQAAELIRQTIKTHNLSQIYPGHDDSSIGDLFQVAWTQIESILYKYEAHPHCAICYNVLRPNESLLVDEFIFADEILKRFKRCPVCKIKLIRKNIHYKGKSKVFNLWSQVARTVILAYIKKENRDRKNGPVFQTHLEHRIVPKGHVLDRFLTEAEEIVKYNKDYLCLLEAIKQLYEQDERPYEGLIAKLVERSGLSRTMVTGFLKMLRLRSHDFSDSPVNEEHETMRRKNTEVTDNSEQE